MRKLHLSFATMLTFSSLSAFSNGKIVCTSEGNNLFKKGSIRPVKENVTASLSFIETEGLAGKRRIENIEGFVRTNPEDEQNSHVGIFKIRSLDENPSYRTTKYKNCSQFPHLDATDTNGSTEGAMDGNLLLEKKTNRESFKAYYIFKSGEHMGGTIRFTCTLQNPEL